MKAKKKAILPILGIFILIITLNANLPYIAKNRTSSGESAIKSSRKNSKSKKGESNAEELLSTIENTSLSLYKKCQLELSGLNPEVFKQALTGYLNFKSTGKITSSILSIADFSLPSKLPRLWIIDLESGELLMHTYVAHGRGSGLKEAMTFSDITNSNQSSLGFYLTGETYQGKHGRSLRLDGMDKGFNSNARSRGIVVHGASYVGEKILSIQDRMGVSQGCPAVDNELSDEIITLIKDRSTFYVYGNSGEYKSAYLNEASASKHLTASNILPELAIDSSEAVAGLLSGSL